MILARRKRPRLIPGAVLVGFAELFDQAYGDPRTPRPYPRVTPSKLGATLLPFPCPHCAAVRDVVVDPRRPGFYDDPARAFSWCPACRGRFVLDRKGMPLAEALPPGARAAPARVERAGVVSVVGELDPSGLELLGVMPPPAPANPFAEAVARAARRAGLAAGQRFDLVAVPL